MTASQKLEDRGVPGCTFSVHSSLFCLADLRTIKVQLLKERNVFGLSQLCSVKKKICKHKITPVK